MIAKLAGECRKPRVERSEYIIAYCKQRGAVYDALFVPVTKEAVSRLPDNVRRIPMLLVYDAEKRLVMDQPLQGCTWAQLNAFQSGTPLEPITADGLHFQKIMSVFSLIDGQWRSPDSPPTYTLLLAWAKFAPKLADFALSATQRLQSPAVEILLLNLDAPL
jgi:hypothetical protein